MGISINNIDIVLAKYAEKNFSKHLYDAMEWNIPNQESYAYSKTSKDIYDAMQSSEWK